MPLRSERFPLHPLPAFSLFACALAYVFSATAWPAVAHQGPPFPILVDRPVGPYLASVWTDPDIGVGTFFVILEPARKGSTPPPASRVEIAVRPVSGRLAEAVHTAERQKVDYGERFYSEVPFDRGERWRVGVTIAGPRGGGELLTEVLPTPDGTLGPGSIALYAAPFLAVGFLWLKATLRRRGSKGKLPPPDLSPVR